MKLEDLKPGRELDALVAENVMGCNVKARIISSDHKIYATEPGKEEIAIPKWEQTLFICQCTPMHIHNCDNGQIPEYSTSIADAWEVVEKITSILHEDIGPEGQKRMLQTWEFKLSQLGDWTATFDKTDRFVSYYAETAPHAICLASLKAGGVGI